MEIIGRKAELKELKKLSVSSKPEFLAIYGRRRIGKTYLIKTFFNGEFDFYITGTNNVPLKQQLRSFHRALRQYSPEDVEYKVPEDWFEAFHLLGQLLDLYKKDEKLVVFFDELPWLDTQKSLFVQALEYFWNSYASTKNILLIVCGSAASWMIHKLIRNRGGLHNRLTSKLRIDPFNLAETEDFFRAKGGAFGRYQIVQLYMCLGGIPFYLEQVDVSLSAVQNIQQLCFSENGGLFGEFTDLYNSLFRKPENYLAIIKALGSKKKGLTWSELLKVTKLPNGGGTSRMIKSLIESGFVKEYRPFGGKVNHRLFQLVDLYSLFYLNFRSDNGTNNIRDWQLAIDDPAQRTWSGYAFEMVCFWHVSQIKKALGVSGVQTLVAGWTGKTEDKGAQIDLILDRRDDVINVFEIKFTRTPFEVTKKYGVELLEKIEIFKQATNTPKAIFLSFITCYGVKKGEFKSAFVQNDLTMDDLFESA